MGAVAQHRHPVGQSEDLRQLVGDIGDADAALAQAPDHLQQPSRIRIRQCGRRLVHDDQLGVLRQGLGDLDPLAVRHREAADDGIDVEIMAVERIEQGASAGPHGGPVHAAPAGARRMADIDVLRHAQLGEQQQFLIDRGDALGRRLAGRGKSDRLAFDPHLAGIGRLHPGDDLDQRGFPGAVLAQQRMDLARPDIEADVVQHPHRAEGFRDPRQFHQRGHSGSASRQVRR